MYCNSLTSKKNVDAKEPKIKLLHPYEYEYEYSVDFT